MLNDTCLIYLPLQLLVKERIEDGGAAAAAVAPAVRQISPKMV